MKIKELLDRDQITFSCEIFPPKKELAFSGIHQVVDQIQALEPAFISVTYGAGGSTSKKTVEVASYIQDTHHIPALAHLTCCDSTREDIRERLAQLKERGIENILALRGDKPKDFVGGGPYTYAIDLIRDIKSQGISALAGPATPKAMWSASTRSRTSGF